MLTIHGWESTFEKADTRKVKGALTWVAMPCDLQSEGLCEILQHPDGAEVLGIWLLLVEYAASKPAGKRDGTIPASAKTLSFSIRVSIDRLENAVSILSSVGWVETDWPCREIVRRSSEDPPKILRRSSDNLRTTGQDRTREERTEVSRSPADLADENQSPDRPADKPRVPRKKAVLAPITTTDALTPAHVLTAWDARWLSRFGIGYARSVGGKEAAAAKRLIAAAAKTAMTPADIGAAMDRFNADQFWGGKDFASFASHFAEFTRDRPKGPRDFTKFGPDDPLFQGIRERERNNRNGNGAGPGVPQRSLPDLEDDQGNDGNMDSGILGMVNGQPHESGPSYGA